MKKVARSACKSNYWSAFFWINHCTSVRRTALCVVPIMPHRILKKTWDLIKLVTFTASSRIFLNETSNIFIACAQWCKLQWIACAQWWRLQFGALLWFMLTSWQFYPPLPLHHHVFKLLWKLFRPQWLKGSQETPVFLRTHFENHTLKSRLSKH